MDKALVLLGAALVAAGISAVPKEKAAGTLAGLGLVPLAVAVTRSRRRQGADIRPRS